VSQRTTLTLDDDVMSRLRAEARRTGRPFRNVVNDAIRRGLATGAWEEPKPFRLIPSDLGLLPGMDLNDVEGLLDRIEGPRRA
jgi:hypothetical protein